MSGQTIDTALAALVALAGTVLTFRTAAKANRLSERKIDTDEFDAQLRRYRELLDQMQEQVDRLGRMLREEQHVSDALRVQVRDLERRQDDLQREYAVLLRRYNELLIANPELPPPEAGGPP